MHSWSMFPTMHSVEYPVLRGSVRLRHETETETPFQTTATMEKLKTTKKKVPLIQSHDGGQTWKRIVDTMRPSCTRTLASRAYFKMKEIMATCVLNPSLVSVHLCESPGGFIQATEDDAVDNWKWSAISLNTPDSPKPLHNILPMHCGSFFDGDVMDFELCSVLIEQGGADLVTADGAYCVCHESVERDHFPLLVAQTRLAFHALAQGGCYLLKFFEGAEKQTLMFIACLTQCFDQVSIIKPTTSRPTNSERYLVARKFQGRRCSNSYFEPGALENVVVSDEWMTEMKVLLDDLARNQIYHLHNALSRAKRVHPC